MAAERNSFPRRWDPCIIGFDLKIIWEMSVKDEPSPHVISVVLSAVEYGKPLPEMGDDLLAFIRDPDHPHLHWLKDDALRAFIRVCPEPIEECKALLEEVLVFPH